MLTAGAAAAYPRGLGEVTADVAVPPLDVPLTGAVPATSGGDLGVVWLCSCDADMLRSVFAIPRPLLIVPKARPAFRGVYGRIAVQPRGTPPRIH